MTRGRVGPAYPSFPPRKAVEVLEARTETLKHTTLGFVHNGQTQPGQFMMVWLPGVDEIPMGYSRIDSGGLREFTVHNVGEATNALCSLEAGDRMWVRGPLGSGFKLRGESILAVGGGCGISPLAPLVEKAAGDGRRVTVALGAVTASDLLMVERLSRSARVHVATDDGTAGYHGLVSEAAFGIMEQDHEKPELVCACGPEKMLIAVAERCKTMGIPCQVSMERYMKCGIGICDSCAVSGIRVCADGPVFSGEEALSMAEFGKTRRGAEGGIIPI